MSTAIAPGPLDPRDKEVRPIDTLLVLSNFHYLAEHANALAAAKRDIEQAKPLLAALTLAVIPNPLDTGTATVKNPI